MKVTINFKGDLRMSSYWYPFTTDDVFEFLRYTKAGLCLLRDKNGREVPLRKRNVVFPEKYLDVYVRRDLVMEVVCDMPHDNDCRSWIGVDCNCARNKLMNLLKVKNV
jgi:hypothetical protein